MKTSTTGQVTHVKTLSTVLAPGDHVTWGLGRIPATVVRTWPSQVFPEYQVALIRTLAPTCMVAVLSRELEKLPTGEDL